jgi:prefoldin beta subunit
MQKDIQQQVAQLQLFEQQMQQYTMQKQTIHVQLVEMDNALEELQTTKEQPFKIVGNVMIGCDKETLVKELQEKKETAEIRLKNVEKQESQAKQKMESLHATVMKQIEQKEEQRGG